jgi:hypothetical protein
MSSSNDEDQVLGTSGGDSTSNVADRQQEDDFLRASILKALLTDVGGDDVLSEQYQLLRQTIFTALKQDLNPSSKIAMVQGDDKDASSTAALEAVHLEDVEQEQVEVATPLSSRTHMYKSLEAIEEKIMSPIPAPIQKKNVSLTPPPSLVALESIVLAKSRHNRNGIRVSEPIRWIPPPMPALLRCRLLPLGGLHKWKQAFCRNLDHRSS